MNTYDKPDWFLAIAPLGQVPVMRVDDTVIFDSRAIWEYLDHTFTPPLLPTQPLKSAEHRAWIGFADDLAQTIGQFVKQGKIVTRDPECVDLLFAILDRHIKGPYFFGENFSMVDIALIAHILWIDALEQLALPYSIIKKYSVVSKWLATMKQRPSIRETMGENYAEGFIALLVRHDLISG